MKRKKLILVLLSALILLSGCSAQPRGASSPKGASSTCPVDFSPIAHVGNDNTTLNQYTGEMLFYQGHVYFLHQRELYRTDLQGQNLTLISDQYTNYDMNAYQDKIYSRNGSKIEVLDLHTGAVFTLFEQEAKKDIRQGGRDYSGYASVNDLLIVQDLLFFSSTSGWHGTSEGMTQGIWAYDLTTNAIYGPLYKFSKSLATNGVHIIAYSNTGDLNYMNIQDVRTGGTMEGRVSTNNAPFSTEQYLFGANGMCYINEDDQIYTAVSYQSLGTNGQDKQVPFYDLGKNAASYIKWDHAKRVLDNESMYVANNGTLWLFKNWNLQEGSRIAAYSHVKAMAMHEGRLYLNMQPTSGDSYHLYIYDGQGKLQADVPLPVNYD